jgi:hypothetical protein
MLLVLSTGCYLQLCPQHERPAHDKLLPSIAQLILGLVQEGLQVSPQHLIQQLVHMLRWQALKARQQRMDVQTAKVFKTHNILKIGAD